MHNIINRALNDMLTFSGVLSIEVATEPKYKSPCPRGLVTLIDPSTVIITTYLDYQMYA